MPHAPHPPPEPRDRPPTAARARGIPPAELLAVINALLPLPTQNARGKDIPRPAAADMAHGGRLLAHLGARELLVEGEHGAHGGAVGVAGAAAARVEAPRAVAAVAGGGGTAGGWRRDACRGGGGWRAEEVAEAAAAGVGVAVLGDRRVRFGDCVAGHFWSWCCWFGG